MFTKLKTDGCDCGKVHIFESEVVIGSGVIADLPNILKSKGFKNPFVFSDNNTYFAAGKKIMNLLNDNGFRAKKYVFKKIFMHKISVNSATVIDFFRVLW